MSAVPYLPHLHGTVNAKTLEGNTLEVVAFSSGVTVNGASVVKAGVAASNAGIHLIDVVILPPS